MFTRIVVGTDGSPTASNAVTQAATLARQFGASLHVVIAYRPLSAYATTPESLPPNIHELVNPAEDARRAAEEAAAKARSEGVEVETHVLPGDAASALIEVAETMGADLIVVGNRGMAGKARFLLGNVPNKVSHHAPCSVLIARTTG